MKARRIFRANPKTPAQRASERVLQDKLQKEKPSLGDLVRTGDADPDAVMTMGMYFDIQRALQALKREREEGGLSIADVAKHSGLDRAVVSRLENGKQDNPTVATLMRYAAAVGNRFLWSYETLTNKKTGRRAARTKAAYTEYLLTYMDILGFKQLVELEPADKIEQILEYFREVASPSEYETKDDIVHLNFSDTNIRAIPLHSKSNLGHPPGQLFFETLTVAHIQCRLIFEGVLTRGSITLGDMFAREGKLFGPAVIKGYCMEESVSVYPRVTVHPEVLRRDESSPLLKAAHHDLETDKKYVLRNLRRDVDGMYYVDYLMALYGQFDEGGYGAFLETHKNLIESRGAAIAELNSVSIKYNWLAEYHNSTVQSLGPHVDGWNASSLLVNSSVFPFRHDL